MSNALKKKSKDKFKFVQKNAREAKEDKAIMTVSTHMQYMVYLALMDVLGFKEKRIRKFYAEMNALKASWADGQAPTDAMLAYCRKKKIPAYEFVKGIPTTKKIALIKPYTCTNVVNFIEAAMLVHVMMAAIILKEEFRISRNKIIDFIEKIGFDIECYTAVQPRSNKPYLNDDMIIQIFRDELKLDLITGNKVA